MSISATRRNPKKLDRRYLSGLLWPLPWLQTIERLQWDARYRSWLREHRPKRYEARAAYFEALCPKNEPITFLEFGVHQGESLLAWLQLNRVPGSIYTGFDAWGGMPAIEGSPFNKGSFTGEPPQIDDPRCELVKGWFDQTLPDYISKQFGTLDRAQQLFLHLDADNYEPTLLVLALLNPYIRPGTMILLDEASVAECEFQALWDWQRSFQRSVIPIMCWRHGRRYAEGVAVEVMS